MFWDSPDLECLMFKKIGMNFTATIQKELKK